MTKGQIEMEDGKDDQSQKTRFSIAVSTLGEPLCEDNSKSMILVLLIKELISQRYHEAYKS
jgi:hypothetical protein